MTSTQSTYRQSIVARFARQTKLTDALDSTLIIAHTESTEFLEAALTLEGFSCRILRQKHKPEYSNYSRSYLCLLNHRRAWKIATTRNQPTLIVEADFVPVLGLGNLPVPYDPESGDLGIAWLYTCAPQVYSICDRGYAEGFSTSGVAYIISPQAAQYLLEFAKEIEQTFGPMQYSSWDSEIDSFLRARKLKNYIPFRNYGEHGGIPNPEHHQHGLSKTHRADILYGKLAFMPLYAMGQRGSLLKLLAVRSRARLKGMGRLLLGKFLRSHILKNSPQRTRLLNFALRRQLSLRL